MTPRVLYMGEPRAALWKRTVTAFRGPSAHAAAARRTSRLHSPIDNRQSVVSLPLHAQIHATRREWCHGVRELALAALIDPALALGVRIYSAAALTPRGMHPTARFGRVVGVALRRWVGFQP